MTSDELDCLAFLIDEWDYDTAHAVALGRLGGQKRSTTLPRERQVGIARKAALARWKKEHNQKC
jgi:hypothetical protein